MKYLVTGATGNIGGRVLAQLIARGERPRALVRDVQKARAQLGEGVELVAGDLADARSLPAALAGIDAIFLVNTTEQLAERDAAAAQAAKAAGVARVVKLSDARPAGAESALGAWHAQGEAAIVASGVAWTFVQPVGFMTNALAWAPSIKAAGVVRAPTGEGKIAMIHPDDIAAVAVAALTSRAYEGASIAITGPRALSYGEMTQAIGAAIDKPLTFETISDESARQRLLANGMPPAHADGLVALWRAVREGRLALVTGEVERITGKAPMAFSQWALENAAAFR